ncbi:MAG: hypothetical protein DRP63_09985 [Planctomycetota bacterium]|nr:MAG: hypothetical protein DRP63_09985 [Planctomycetota bacterium]
MRGKELLFIAVGIVVIIIGIVLVCSAYDNSQIASAIEVGAAISDNLTEALGPTPGNAARYGRISQRYKATASSYRNRAIVEYIFGFLCIAGGVVLVLSVMIRWLRSRTL